jgi:predicted membrane channel-forming protein YqfA (hemolysin III family)
LILSFLSLYSLSIACFCKTFYRRPYPFSHKILQCSGVLVVYLYQIWPILKNLFFTFIFYNTKQNLVESEEKALFWHLIQFISFILSGLIFVTRVPERFCPGSFDLFGQSHHAFHLTIFLVAYSQANAVFEDMLSISSNNIQYNLMKDILYTLIVLILQLISISLWFRISRPTIEQRYKIDLKK